MEKNIPHCAANNSLLMFKRQSANNEGGATAGDGSCVDEQLQKQAPSSWKAQQPPVMEIAAVDSKESKSVSYLDLVFVKCRVLLLKQD